MKLFKYSILIALFLSMGSLQLFSIDPHTPNVIWEKQFDAPEFTGISSSNLFIRNNNLFLVYVGRYTNGSFNSVFSNVLKTDLNGNEIFRYQLYQDEPYERLNSMYYVNDMVIKHDTLIFGLKANVPGFSYYQPQIVFFKENEKNAFLRYPDTLSSGYNMSNLLMNDSSIFFIHFFGKQVLTLFQLNYKQKIQFNAYNLLATNDLYTLDKYYPLNNILSLTDSNLIMNYRLDKDTYGLFKNLLVNYKLSSDTAQIIWSVVCNETYIDSYFSHIHNLYYSLNFQNIKSFSNPIPYNFYINLISKDGQSEVRNIIKDGDATVTGLPEILGLRETVDGKYFILFGDNYLRYSNNNNEFLIYIFDKNWNLVEQIEWENERKCYISDVYVKENGNLIVWGKSGYDDYKLYLAEIKPNYPASVNEENIFLKNINISPNPATDYINVGDYFGYDYQIIDLLGNAAASGTVSGEKINVSRLLPGFYGIVFTKGGTSKTEKFIKGE